MNVVAVARFLGNFLVAFGFVTVLFVLMPMFPNVSGSTWALSLFAAAGIGIFVQVIAVAGRPTDAVSAWDEQSKASNQASYVFGYWCVMAVFLVFLLFVLTGEMTADQAFLWLGAPLGIAPALYMVVAFLRGRAG